MTTNKPIRVQIKPQIVALLEPIKPEHQTMSTFINDLLYRTSKGLTPYATLNLSSEQSSPEKTKEKKPKTGRCEFDVKRHLWIVFNGEEWVEVDLKKHYCNFKNDKNIN